ncbi:MAG: PEP-CTERM sorting domain-containing protein [Verrucomicrobiae bacterium]|nr:PEP-CTERM sorting domain-containing protein [Verrucomicrobiae bacterium]
MKSKSLTGLVTSLAMVAAVTSASAQGMFDNFDSYTLGSIHGQGGWEGWTGTASVAGTVTTAQGVGGSQSLQVVTGNDTVRPFTGVASGVWTLSLLQYIPSSSSGISWVILMNSYPANLNWSAQMYADITAGQMRSYEVDSASVALVTDQWVPIRFDINLTDNSVASYYNDTLLATHAWQSGGLNQLQALDLYPDEGAGTAQVGPVYYDNLQLSIVPEPTSLCLLLLGGLAFLIRSRKQA